MTTSVHIQERILESLQDGVMTLAASGTILSFNRAAETILGIRREDALGGAFGELFLDRPENDAFVQAVIDAVYERRTIHQNVVTYFDGSTNRSLTIRSSHLDLPADEEADGAVVVVISDITETELYRLLAHMEALTGAWNRAYLQDTLPKEIKRAARYEVPLSVVMTDIDFFKKVNDTYGHHGGDLVLKAFADCMRRTLRDGVDWIARYGGEEFVILLPETDPAGAAAVAEKIRLAAEAMVVREQTLEIRITASFGVTTFDGGTDAPSMQANELPTVPQLLEQADQRLYLAKERGRNQVVAA